MLLYHICRAAHRALDGEGAQLYGGRWSSPGRPVVYTSSSLSLAALEYLIHLDPSDVPDDLLALTIDVPVDLPIDRVRVSDLAPGWERMPEPPTCKNIGDAWLTAGAALALRVPAAPAPEETNVLLNPQHPDAGHARIVAERPFFYDPRLFA